MKRFINSLLAVFILLFSFSVKATNYYVNDGSIVSDVYTSAIGNDANSGTVTAPFKTLKKALIVAVAGDFIYVDYGLYLGGAGGTLGIDFGLSVSVDNLTIIGAGMGSTVFQSNKNKGTFLTILANNFSISNLSMHAYGFGSGGSGVGQTITIGNGATAYSGILFSNIQLDQNGGSAGETAVFIKSKTSSTFSGGGASCNTVSSTYSGGFTVSGTNIDVLFDNYVFAFNSGDCFGGTAGGSVRVVGGNSTEHVTIKNCVFSNGVACSSTFNGMDLYLTTGDIKVYDCLFDSSHSAYATGTAVGGSVAINGSPTVYITRSKFTNHSATGGMNGAAIGNKGGALTLDSCFFSGNSANKADDVHSSSGTINANYCQWSEIGQTGGTFTIVNSGNPSVFEGTVTKTNTTASSYTSNPTVPSFSGVCGAVVITPPCTNPLATTIGVITQPTCSTPTGSVALSGLPATGTWTVTESIGNTTITGTGTTATFSGLTAGQTYSFIVSVSGGCVSPASANAILNAAPTVPAAPTGDATQTFCSASNPTVASLTTTSGTSIQWYLASSGGVALAVGTALVDGLHYYATQTVTGCESATRLDVLVAITASPVVPTGNATQTFCSASNSTVASLSATGTAIKWYLAATGGLALPTGTALIDATHYFATQTVTGCESDTRYDVLVSITSSPVLIITDPTAVCAPLTIDITLGSVTAGSTGGGALTFWDNNTSTLPQLVTPSALAVSGTYYIQSSIGGCSDIKPVEVLINNCSCPLNLVITDPTPVCSPLTVNLSAPAVTSGSTGGGALTYYSDIACLLPLVSPVISAVGTTIYYIKSDNGTCNDSEAVNVTINASPLVPSGNSPQTFCSGTSPTVADLTTTMGAFIQWYSLSSGGAALIGGSLLTDATHYYATQFDGTCESATRLDVLVNVTPTPIAPVGSTEQSFCSSTNPTVANLVTTSGVAVQWYDAAVAGVLIPGGTALNDATHYYATQTVAGCESLLSLDVLVAVATSPIMPTGDTGQTFCSGSNSTVADLITTSGINIKWYNTLIGGGLLPSITPLVDGAHYYSTQTVGVCESTPRLDVTVTITNSPSAPTGLASQVFCSGSNPTVANLVATGSAIKWYDAANGGAIVTSVTALVDGAHYFATQTVGVCESTTRLDVTVTITNSPSAPTGLASQVFCSGSNPTVANLTTLTGLGVKWYDLAVAGSELSGATPLVNGSHYFATQTSNGCESTTRLDVLVIVISEPATPIGNANQHYCQTANATIKDLLPSGISINWYAGEDTGVVLDASQILENNIHYYATQSIGGCESILRLDVTVHISKLELSKVSHVKPFCGKSNGAITVLASNGIGTITYAWNDGSENPSNTEVAAGNYTVTATDSVGCVAEVSYVIDCEKSDIPQIITPDGNGKNDTWVLLLDKKSEVQIFNRWGSIVYTAQPYNDDWSGQTNKGITLGNDFLPSGTYFYIIDNKDGEKPLSGYIELVR